MRDYTKLKENLNNSIDKTKDKAVGFKTISSEAHKVSEVARDVNIIIRDIEMQFEKATKLNKVDISFLLFATALQCARQYLLTQFHDRLNDKDAAKMVKGGVAEHSDRHHSWYNPSMEQIIANPVPYDAMTGSKTFNAGGGTSHNPRGLGGSTHRFETPGHDPLLGWIFGTANIATSTLTTWDMQSYHIRTGRIDEFRYHANTAKVFSYTKDRLFQEPQAVAAAVAKQGLHIRSDVYSTQGLPIPIIGAVSPELTRKLADTGIDYANTKTITQQAGYALLINLIIGMIHKLCYDEAIHGNHKLYEVKTRKIITYSNTIASVSNIIQVAFRSFILRDAGAIKSLDIGGFLVTLYRLINDYKFIKEVKFEFLDKEFYNIVMGNEFNFQEGS